MNQETPTLSNTAPTSNSKTQAQINKEIADQLFKEKDDYEKSTQTQRQECLDIYNAYMGKMENVKQLPYKSQETIPKLRTEIAYVKPFIFSGTPEIQIEGVGDEDKLIASILEKIVNYRIQNSIPYALEKIEDWVHQAVTFGTSIIKVLWRFETETDEMGAEFETVVKDEPDLEVPNILDVYRNPLIPEVSGQSSMIFRSVLTLEDIKNNPAYDFQNDMGEFNREKIEPKGNFQNSEYDTMKQNTQEFSNLDKATKGLVEVFERVTKDRIQTVADGKEKLVLRDVQHTHGMINAVKFVFEKNTIPNRFDGLGVGHNTLGLGKLYYKMINQSLDSVILSNNPMFLFAKGTKIDKRQMVAKPGGGVEVDTGDKNLSDVIQPMAFPDIKQGAVMLIEKIEEEHKRASGANDLVQGSASNDTLGQDQIAQANISNRFELIQRRFKQALVDLAEMLIKLELENLQDINSPVLRIFPQELREQVFLLLKNESQDVKYNIKVKGETTIAKNKDITVKQLIDWFNVFGQILMPNEQRAIARRILELRGETNIDELVAEQPPMMPMDPGLMNGQEMSPVGSQFTQQGINNSTYAQ